MVGKRGGIGMKSASPRPVTIYITCISIVPEQGFRDITLLHTTVHFRALKENISSVLFNTDYMNASNDV